MSKNYQSAEILRHKKRGDFLLSFLVRDPRGGWRQSGKPIRVEPAEMARRGLDLLLEGLANIEAGPLTFAPREDQLGPKEVREYSWVDFKYFPVEAIELLPLHRESGGHVGDPEEAVRLALPVSAEQFWQVLSEVLDEC